MFQFSRETCVLFLHYYLSIDEGSIRTDVSATKSEKPVKLSSLSSERIRELARFAGFEKTSNWHHALADILRVAGHVDDAIEEFEVAFHMDGHNWWAMWGMGCCYDIKRDFSRSLDWFLKAIKVIPEEEVDWRCCIWSYIGICRKELGDMEGAVEASRQACLASPEDRHAMGRQLGFLGDTARYREILDLAERLDKQPASAGHGSALTELLLEADVHEPIATAARALGRLDFAIDALQQAYALAEKMNDDNTISNQRYFLAKVYYSMADNEDRAVQLWEDVIANSTSHIELIKSAALNSLSEVYFDRARTAENSEADPAVWVSQLQRLSRIPIQPAESEEDEFAREMGNPSLMLGLWYRLHGKQDEARACFRASILEGIGYLTDKNPYNDRDGYMSLGQALLKAGDKANAMAAVAILVKPFHKFRVERARKAGASHKPDKVRTGTKAMTGDEKGLKFTGLDSTESAASNELLDRHIIKWKCRRPNRRGCAG